MRIVDTWNYALTGSTSPWKRSIGNGAVSIPDFINITRDDAIYRDPLYIDDYNWHATFQIKGISGKELIFYPAVWGMNYNIRGGYIRWIGDVMSLSGEAIGSDYFGAWYDQELVGDTFQVEMYVKPKEGTLRLICGGVDSGDVPMPGTSWMVPMLVGTNIAGDLGDAEALRVYGIEYIVDSPVIQVYKEQKFLSGDILIKL